MDLMDFVSQLEAIQVWYASATVIIAVLLYWYGTANFDVFKRMGVEESKSLRLPFLGNILDLVGGALNERDIVKIREHPSRTYGNFIGRQPFLNSFDVDLLKAVTIKEFPTFMNRRNAFEAESGVVHLNIFAMRDEHWKNGRSILTPTFTSGKLKAMYPVINNCADKLIKHVHTTSSKAFVVKDYTSGYTMDVIASTAFGMDIDTQTDTTHPFIEHAGTFFGIPRRKTIFSRLSRAYAILSLLLFPTWWSKFQRRFLNISFFDDESLEYFENVVDRVMKDRESDTEERKDFVSMCMDLLVDTNKLDPDQLKVSYRGFKWTPRGLTRAELMANAMVFFSAGYETTATALQFLFYNLAMHPETQEKLYEAILERGDRELTYEELQKFDYLEWCINETFRLFPPVLRFDRIAKHEITINNITIPKDMVVAFVTTALHYDPEYWPEPETFNPERFSPENRTEDQHYAFVPFGSGSRNCIAKRLAMLEVKVAAYKMVREFQFERTPETPDIKNIKFKKLSGFLATDSPLKIKAVPRKTVL